MRRPRTASNQSFRNFEAREIRAYRARGLRVRISLRQYERAFDQDRPKGDDVLDSEFVEWLDEHIGRWDTDVELYSLWVPDRRAAFELKIAWG
ncbi:hypothetical protein ACFZ8E_07400 [Methylobacterium sp. HMF5984]|uniref:hypothetical protein n=1 Tax=Methylobacterium sp. HMF5984 TaxID=3367370 RepID=UPI0038519FA9